MHARRDPSPLTVMAKLRAAVPGWITKSGLIIVKMRTACAAPQVTCEQRGEPAQAREPIVWEGRSPLLKPLRRRGDSMPAPSSTVSPRTHHSWVWDDHVRAVPDLLRGEDASRSAVTYGKECAGCDAMAASRAGAPVRGGCCHRCGAVRADADDASCGSSAGRVIVGGLRRGRGCRLRGAGVPAPLAAVGAVGHRSWRAGAHGAGAQWRCRHPVPGGLVAGRVHFCVDQRPDCRAGRRRDHGAGAVLRRRAVGPRLVVGRGECERAGLDRHGRRGR